MSTQQSLLSGAVLDGNYQIVQPLDSGAFFNTYLATDLGLNCQVMIKELRFAERVRRGIFKRLFGTAEGRNSSDELRAAAFFKEVRLLTRFRHPSIARVVSIFEANQTIYTVLEHVDGESLEQSLRSDGGIRNQPALDRISMSVLDVLETLHRRRVLLRNVAPGNIILRRADGAPVLLDFFSAKTINRDTGRDGFVTAPPPYIPMECYAAGFRNEGPWTDIYSFSATLYRAVTGEPPPSAADRALDDKLIPALDLPGANQEFRPEFLAAIDHGLRLRPTDRPQSIAEWRPKLLGPS